MKHFTIVGNWKMHQTPDEAVSLTKKLQNKVEPHTHVTSVLCPPFVDLAPVKEVIEGDKFKLGAQNINENDEGAFTGEVSGALIRGLAEYVIVGHSERRRYQHETDKQVATKVAAAVRNGLKPILCIGENLDQREHKLSKRVVVDQLHGALHGLTADDATKLLVAYEPVWAISEGDGKGHFDSPEDVKEMASVVKETVEELFGEAAGVEIEVLYGGSANPDNARAYLEVEGINGLLVGGASLNYEHFSAIIKTAQEIADK